VALLCETTLSLAAVGTAAAAAAWGELPYLPEVRDGCSVKPTTMTATGCCQRCSRPHSATGPTSREATMHPCVDGLNYVAAAIDGWGISSFVGLNLLQKVALLCELPLACSSSSSSIRRSRSDQRCSCSSLGHHALVLVRRSAAAATMHSCAW
jgi:hypothetical protein